MRELEVLVFNGITIHRLCMSHPMVERGRVRERKGKESKATITRLKGLNK